MSDPLVDLEALLQELPDAVDRRRLGEALSRSLQALSGMDRLIERIGSLLELSDVLDLAVVPAQAGLVREVRDEAWEVGDALTSAASEEDLRAAVWNYEKSLQNTVAALDRAVRQHWRSVVATRFQPLVGLGDLLARLGASADFGRRLAACGRSAQAVGEGIASGELLAQVRSLLSEIEDLHDERRDAIGEGIVGEFLNALAEGRATLAMVDDEVNGWLERNQAMDRLRISPA